MALCLGRRPAFAFAAVPVGRAEDLGELELEEDVACLRLVAGGPGKAERFGAPALVGHFCGEPGDIELALSTAVVLDAAVQRVAFIAPQVGGLGRSRLHIDIETTRAD